MGMGKKLGLILLLWGFLNVADASSNLTSKPAKTCNELSKDLEGMKNAQNSLLSTFVRKNEMMASVLEQNASKMEAKIEQNQGIKISDIHSLKNSAEAYRAHDLKEKELVSKFEKASENLIQEIQKCISQNENRQSVLPN